MYKFILFFFLSVFFATQSFAEVVKKINISGNERVSDETVKIYGKIDHNSDYSEKDLNNILNNLYSTNFFEDVQVILSNGILNVKLTEFPVINELLILGEPSKKYKEEIIKIIQLKQKDSFIRNKIASDTDRIKSLYSSIGYNFVEVTAKVRKIDEKNVDLIFEVNRGEITKISKITFTGDKKVKEKRLRELIASEEDRFWKLISKNTKYNQSLVNLDLRLLKNYYKSIGYYDVNILSNSAEIQKSGNVELKYSIDAGNRYFIKKIETNTDPVFDKNIFFPLNKEYEKVIGTYYSPFKIKKLLEGLDELIERNNLQFVEHNVEEIIENDNIIIKFNITEGEKVLIERINVIGNNVTNENVIRGEFLIDEGDPFTKLSLDKSVAKLKSRNIFKSVESLVKEGSEKNLKIIDISVEEKATGEISAGAGFGTNGGSVGFSVQENNWLGQGKNVGFNIDVDKESFKGTLAYTDPNYDSLGNSLSYYLSSVNNDKPNQGYENSLTSAGISTSFEQFKDIRASIGIAASYDNLKAVSGASDSLKKQEGAFTQIDGNYGFTIDKRNRAFNPTDGSIASFSQTLPIYADRATITNTFGASTYKTVTENIIGAVKFYASAINGLNDKDVRLSKRNSLGNRIRGFELNKIGPVDGADFIGGNYASALNFEADLPNILPESTKTDVSLFLDFGNVWGVDYDATIDDSNKIRSSTGAAASWMSPLGPMTFIVSQNISKATTDKTENFSFNLGTTF